MRRFRRTVGRSVDSRSRSRSLSTSSDGYTDRTDRYRETPTRGRADETDRYDSSSDSTDGRTDGRSDDADPPVDRYPSSIRSSAAALRAALSVIFNEVSHSVGSGRRALSRASGVRSVTRDGFGCLYSSKEASSGKAGESSDGRARTRTRITEDEEVV